MVFSKTLSAVVLTSLAFSVAAEDRTSVAQQAAIQDPAQQCTFYNYPPIAGQAANYPKSWEIATIIDDEARAKYNSLKDGIPNIPPKDPENGLSTYNLAQDPDCWWTGTECTQPKTQGLPPDLSLVPEPQTLGYGFDDGPNCSHNAFYDFLTSQNQKATMFFIGSNVLGWPLQAKRALEDGHEICVHTWSHNLMTSLNNEQAFAEIWYTLKVIKLVTGATPTCFRPPQGDVDDRIRYFINALGLKNILWKYDTRDTIPNKSTGQVEVADVEKNYETFLAAAKSGTFNTQGTILLAHETNNMTMSEAIKYYPQIKAAFKNIVPVNVALNNTHPYVEDDFTVPTFDQYVGGQIQVTGPAPPRGSTTGTSGTRPTGTAGTTSAKPTNSASGNTTNSNGAASLSSAPFIVISLSLFSGLLAVF